MFDISCMLYIYIIVIEIKLLHSMYYYIENDIVKQCVFNSMHDSNTAIGFKLAFIRENFNIDIYNRF